MNIKRFDCVYVLKHYVYKERLLFVTVLLTGIFLATSTIIFPYLSAYAVDILLHNKDTYSFGMAILLIGIFFFLSRIIAFAWNYCTVKLHFKSAYRLNIDAISHIQRLPLAFFQKESIIYLSRRINDDAQDITNFLVQNIATAFVNAVCTCACVVIVFSQSVFLGITLCISATLYIVVSIITEKLVYSVSMRQKECSNHFFDRLHSLLENILFIKIYSLYEYLKNKTNAHFYDLLNSNLSIAKVSWMVVTFGDLIKYGTLTTVLALSGLQFTQGQIQLKEFIIENAFFYIFFNAMIALLLCAKESQTINASVQRMKDIFRMPQEKYGSLRIGNIESICLDHICHAVGAHRLYTGLSHNFQKGHIYLIQGRNGSGKSTLLNIISGLVAPLSGMVFWNSTSVQEIDR
ncbi:MAG: ABC transporter ATP-binding protein, partial [Treponema sp.]|nr:ABC transporter ATP-binding protein [Treponema sp.]